MNEKTIISNFSSSEAHIIHIPVMRYSIIRIKIYFPSIISNTDLEYSYIYEYSGRNKTILNKELLIYDHNSDGQYIHLAASYFIANSQSNYVKLEIKTKKDYKNVEFVLI